MGISVDCVLNELKFDQKLFSLLKTYNKYVNFRFDYVIRSSIAQVPSEITLNNACCSFDNRDLFVTPKCFGESSTSVNSITSLQNELKSLTNEANMKRKEINIISLNEEGLKKNIKHLEEIIAIKENLITQTANHTEIRCNAKEKAQKEYQRISKKYSKILNADRLNDRVLRYERKIKKMDDIIRIAGDSQEKLMQDRIALQTSKDRLKIFYEQYKCQIQSKEDLTSVLLELEKRINQLKINLSNLGVITSIEKSRSHTSCNIIEQNNLKKSFIELQLMRNEVLSCRPKGIFNPKYHKENSLTKEEIKKYLENDETIDAIDHLIELKNNQTSNYVDWTNLNHSNSIEGAVFLKSLNNLTLVEIKKLLIHYFNKVIDLKESGRENDEIISKLDEINDKQRRTIVSLNNNYQEFHLSVEKKFIALKKYYHDKVNMLFQLLQEENNAITVFKMRQEISALKKKLSELEKSQQITKPIDTLVLAEPQQNSDHLDISRSESETMSSAKVTFHKNKLKVQKNKTK
ncbi:kinesin-like protein costa [Daktulosphaira vitifoliae]|uniref:kinesin-like protein costa n=1 Tax=Daktulosphaira vitifoliae TaxID=58002 RepID=UPI0021A9AD8A|nr:kinesin-like protein costa [Daktulosphaira vitifoliae]XP_050529961.1 kinesin-like protein costa [Daktulosphaira vitifoliae]